MTVTLRTESLDDDPEEKIFPSLDEAINYAVSWFVDAYKDNETIVWEDVKQMVEKDASRMVDDLKNGREFSCSLFYERVSIVSPAST